MRIDKNISRTLFTVTHTKITLKIYIMIMHIQLHLRLKTTRKQQNIQQQPNKNQLCNMNILTQKTTAQVI